MQTTPSWNAIFIGDMVDISTQTTLDPVLYHLL